MSLNQDLYNNISVKTAIMPQAVSATTDLVGEIIDTHGYDSCTFALITDAIAGSTTAAVLLVEDGASSTLSDAAAVTAANLIGTTASTAITSATSAGSRRIGYSGAKRYVRLTFDITANNGTDSFGAVCILGHPKQGPVAANAD